MSDGLYLTTKKNAEAHATLLTEAFDPSQVYELSVVWPSSSKRMTYLARSASEHEHLGMVVEAAKDVEAECLLRCYKSTETDDVSCDTLGQLVAHGKFSTRAVEQFQDHAPGVLKAAVAGLLSREGEAVMVGQRRGDGAISTNKDRLSKALDLIRPYASYRVQALEGDSADRARTVCIDFDGVLSEYQPGQYPEMGEPLPGAIEALHTLKDKGFDIVILSSRALKPEGRTAIMDWLDSHGAPDVVVTGEKIPAEIYLDDRAQHFQNWTLDLPRLLESMEAGKEIESHLCTEDKSILERVGSKYVCPACDRETGILQTVSATLYTLLPGDKVHVKGLGSSTAGDAYLISKASAQEETALLGSDLWLVKYANGDCLPIGEVHLNKIGHDLQSQRAAEDVILGYENKLTRIGDQKMSYNLDNVVEAALSEASEGLLPLDAVLISIGTRFSLSPDDLDFVAEQLMDLEKKAEVVGPTTAQLTDCVRDALVEVNARSVEASLSLTAEEEVDMVIGYVAEEYELKSEAMNVDLETKVKDLIQIVRGGKEVNAGKDLKIKVKDGLIYYYNSHLTSEVVGTYQADAIARAEGFEYAEQFVKAHDGQVLTLDIDTYKIKAEMEDAHPTNLPSLTSKPESEYDTTRFQTEAEGDMCMNCGSSFTEGVRCCDNPRKGAGEGPVMKGEVKEGEEKEHKLKIISLDDVQAECTGCGWHMMATGARSREYVQEVFDRSHKKTKKAYTGTTCISCDRFVPMHDGIKNEHGAGFLCRYCAPEWNKDDAPATEMVTAAEGYKGETFFVALGEDDNVIAASMDANARNQDYWDLVYPDDVVEVAIAENVPPDLTLAILAHGTSGQKLPDGYSAFSAIKDYLYRPNKKVLPAKQADALMRGNAYVMQYLDESDINYDAKVREIIRSSESTDTKYDQIKARIVELIQEKPNDDAEIKQVDWDDPEVRTDIIKMIEDYDEEQAADDASGIPERKSSLKKAEKPVDIESVLRDYLVAALWSTTNSETGESWDATRGINDFSPASVDEARKIVTQFVKDAGDLLSGLDAGQIGHDIWLTRNGHGAGFWDRGLGEKGERLTELAEALGEEDIYANDENGELHFEHEGSKQASILNASLQGLALDDQQKKIVASIRQYIDEYTPDFLRSVGQFFVYEWDPGSSWEVREVEGKKQIVRREVTSKKEAPMGRHAFKEGQVLKMYASFFPADVKVIALIGEDRYKVKSQIDGTILEADEDDLMQIDASKGIFN